MHLALKNMVVAAMLLFLAKVSGQSCCAGSGSLEFAKVGRCLKGVITSRVSYSQNFGTYQSSSNFSQNSSLSRNMNLNLGVGYSIFSPNLQVFVGIPIIYQSLNYTNDNFDYAFGLGDVSGGFQWTVLQDKITGFKAGDLKSWVPFWDISLGFKFPTGRNQTSNGNRVAVMSEEYYQFFVQNSLIKFITSKYSTGFQFTYDYRFAGNNELLNRSNLFEPGNRLVGGMDFQYIHNLYYSFSLNSRYEFVSNNFLGDEELEDSGRRRFQFGLGIRRVLVLPKWDLLFSSMTDSWWNGAGKNIPYPGINFSLTLRRNFI